VGLIGRDELLADLRREVTKGRHVLLTGPAGIGKSALLRALYTHLQTTGAPAVFLEQASPAKPMLVELAHQLHERFHALPYADLLGDKAAHTAPEALAWHDLHKAVSRLQIRDLAHVLFTALEQVQPRCILVMDALEHVTPTQHAILLRLFQKAQIVGATTGKKPDGHLARLSWGFKLVEVPPLADQDCLTIVERFIAQRHILVGYPAMFRRHVLKAAGGSPEALRDILENAAKEGLIVKKYIRQEVQHQAGEHYFDLTPFALLGIFGVMAARFLARGMDSQDLYIVAGVSGALLMFARFFLSRGMRRT